MEMHYWPPYIRSTDNRGGGITAPSRFQDGGDTNGDNTHRASHDVKVFYGYPGKSFFSRSLMTGEYTIYISVDSADPGAVIDLALEYIRSHQKEVAV